MRRPRSMPSPGFAASPRIEPCPCSTSPRSSFEGTMISRPKGMTKMAEQEGSLNDERRRAGLTITQLWVRYFALGGNASVLELEGYLYGALRPEVLEHDRIVHAINERHQEQGDDHPVPYAREAS